MSFDWRLLGEGVIVQSVPRLLEQHGVTLVLPSERTLYGASLHEFDNLFTRYEEALQQLFREFGVSWRDVYLNSDVGKERVELGKKMDIDADDNVLDVGCGRGFFTLAVAERAKSVVGLDLMNGFGRNGWWRKFKTVLKEFDLQSRVFEARGSAMAMPFEDQAFSVAASVHAIRNFQDTKVIEGAFKEMKRVVRKGGRIFIVETLPIATNKAQEAHLKMFECKVKYTRSELPFFTERELTSLLRKAGFSGLNTQTFDFNLSAAPPFFLLDTSVLPEELRANTEREYAEAVEAVRKCDEVSPPVLFIEAIV